jgi:hypothetical protein
MVADEDPQDKESSIRVSETNAPRCGMTPRHCPPSVLKAKPAAQFSSVGLKQVRSLSPGRLLGQTLFLSRGFLNVPLPAIGIKKPNLERRARLLCGRGALYRVLICSRRSSGREGCWHMGR